MFDHIARRNATALYSRSPYQEHFVIPQSSLCTLHLVYNAIFTTYFYLSPWYFDWALKPQVNHTGWMTVVAPADRPKSVRNRCVIERFCSVFE